VVNRYHAFVVAIGVSCNLTARPKLTAAGFGLLLYALFT